MGLYEFKEEDAFRFASENGLTIKRRGKELQFNLCPFCRGGRHKEKYTFSIDAMSGACNCKRSGCSYHGNMITIAQETGFHLSEDVVRRYNISNYNGRFKRFREEHKKETTPPAIEYLGSRGIPEEIVNRYGITTKKDSEDILVFPFRDEKGELRFIKYRNMNFKKGEGGSKEWCESNCMPILFGMDQVNGQNPRLIITEGQIDSLSVAAAGFENALSVPMGKNGFTWVGHCWEFINRFHTIVIFGDKEDNGMTLLDDLKRRFTGIEILSVRSEDYKDCKDANEILQKYGIEQVRACINNAEGTPLSNVRNLADIVQDDPFRKEKLATGIKSIDKHLYGGLTFGGYSLIIGKAGEGKSTFANQIICQALNQGHNCFVYSGELTNAFFKNGIDRQLAGQKVIKYQDATWHDIHYSVPLDIQAKISEWYKNRCYIYSDEVSDTDDDEKREEFFEIIEKTVARYNVRVVLVDNLMTALDLERIDSQDRFEKQASFVRGIARLARKLNILILLVAHKRKQDSGDSNDNIMGTSDIANLATVIFDFSRDKVENQNIIKISKERIFGRTEKEGFKVQYDPCSKRIYETEDDLAFKYSWADESKDGFEAMEETDEIPF